MWRKSGPAPGLTCARACVLAAGAEVFEAYDLDAKAKAVVAVAYPNFHFK
jgi:hypothetical protein